MTPDPKRVAKTATGATRARTSVPPPPPPPPGARGPVLVPGYTLTREISRGGQGAVYEAAHAATTRRVAIKLIAGGAMSSPREKARFDQEAKILAALDHPGIVRVLDRGTTPDGSMFLVMDFVSGKPLTDCLPDRSNPVQKEPAEFLRLFLKIADAVNAAHLRGVVHRDLKPANIIVDDHGEPHILDFGLARTGLARYADKDEREPVTITGTFLGSLPWSSPEQADGQTDKIDMRTDVYALGVILYQMLTGEFPYAIGGTMRETLTNITQAQPMPPSRLLESREGRAIKRGIRLTTRRGKLNATIDAIVLKALAKRREDRYQSAGEMARDIGNYLSGRPTLATGGGCPVWRRPVVLIPSCVAAGMLLCGGLIFALRDNPTIPAMPPVASVTRAAVEPTAAPVAQPATKEPDRRATPPVVPVASRPAPVATMPAPVAVAAMAPSTLPATRPAETRAVAAAEPLPATRPAPPERPPEAVAMTRPAPPDEAPEPPPGWDPNIPLPPNWKPGMPLPPEAMDRGFRGNEGPRPGATTQRRPPLRGPRGPGGQGGSGSGGPNQGGPGAFNEGPRE